MSSAPKRPKIAPEAPTTGVSHASSSPVLQADDRRGAGEQRHGDLAADAADQVDRREAGPPEHRLEVLPQRPQREHVEQDVEVGRRASAGRPR